MRIHRQNGLPEPPPGRADPTTDVPARHLRWRPRRRRNRGRAPASDTGADQTARVQATRVQAAPTAQGQGALSEPMAAPGGTMAAPGEPLAVPGEPLAAPGEPMAAPGEPISAPGETMVATMQLAIALLTAGLDSAELEEWAADELIPADADGLADLMAGLHVMSVVLLSELHEATGEPPAAILQRLAMLAEHGRGTPSAG
jgi:hypothetical protein